MSRYCLRIPELDFPLYFTDNQYWSDNCTFTVYAEDDGGKEYTIDYDASDIEEGYEDTIDWEDPSYITRMDKDSLKCEDIYCKENNRCGFLDKTRDMDVLRKGLKEQYQKDIPNGKLLEEAIVAIENHYEWTNDLEFEMTMNRPLTIAYLALKHEQEKRETIKMEE